MYLNLYFAAPRPGELLMLQEEGVEYVLVSFDDKESMRGIPQAQTLGIHVALDSGAFAVVSRGAVLDLNAYATHLEQHASEYSFYVNLDVCTDPIQTARNQQFLEARGLCPMPVFHFGEDESYLRPMLKHEYIGLGNSMLSCNRPHGHFIEWINGITQRYPGHKFHGFAVGSIVDRVGGLHSADSTAWLTGGRFRKILGRHGEIDARRMDCFLTREEIIRNNIRALKWRAENATSYMVGEPLFTVGGGYRD